ncbi:MAG: hypothetical protein E7081_02540 [Bacteroidales bacterium]|nr:hypothetical protein [Bacteroidales bacterium]
MANHTISFSDEEYKKAAEKWKRELLLMPLFSCQDTLKYMTGMPGVRNALHLGTAESNAQFAPYRSDRKSANTTDVKFRTLRTYFGNACEDFEPNAYITTLLGEGAAFLGDGQAKAPSAKLVLACVAKSLGAHLNDAIFTAKRDGNGNTTHDLFDGFSTIADTEIISENISVANGNLLELDGVIDNSNAVDIAKMIERKADPHLRRLDKFLFCDPAFADAYNDNYLLTHSGISYNTKFNQAFVEGSNNKTTIVPLDCLAGTDKYFLTPKSNMLYGYDSMSDVEKIVVDRFSPWMLTFAAAMFFGTEFYTVDKRLLQVVKLKSAE